MSQAEQITVEWVADIAFLLLSADESVLPVLNAERMAAIEEAIDELTKGSKKPKGLVILGSQNAGFCAGADVHAIQGVVDSATGAKLAAKGQALFGKISAAGFPTVAAIHGPCVGGGYELALACTYRIALHSDDTRIGLPEIKLGILPGFGGTQRLPRLIGAPKALEIILNGKVISAVRASNSGMVDVLVPANGEDKVKNLEALRNTAVEILEDRRKVSPPKISLAEKLITKTALGRYLAQKKAHAGILKETNGHYPAPLRALEVTIKGSAMSLENGLKLEAEALGDLIVTPESKSLVHIYFCSEASSKLGRSMREGVKKRRVGVLGAGVMGSGIATVFLLKGYPVTVLDPSAEARARAEQSITKAVNSQRGLTDAQRKALLEALSLTDKMHQLNESDLVVEAIIEDLAIKRETLQALAEVVSGDCIIASNTSSLSIADMGEGISSPDRIIGMHFFNPAEKMPLVELVRGPHTSGKTLATVSAYASGIGKYPVVVEDVPGFLVNRILSAYIAEAGRLLSEGVAIEEIDRCATSFGMPMGPFRMLDEVGLDVAAKVQEGMTATYGERMLAPEFPKMLVADGRLGRKSGYGFYSFQDQTPTADASVYEILGVRPVREGHLSNQVVEDRLILSLVQEAVRCLDEEVAGLPGGDSAGQIDLATVMGMGFAPFRGGVLYYADTLGVAAVVEKLRSLEQRFGNRFAPVDGLLRREREQLGFFETDSVSLN